MPRTSPHDVIVIGAGMAGLLAAHKLTAHGYNVAVLDKGRGVGGRMATRRIGPAVFDHGAQFFTAREDRFAALVREWKNHGVVKTWANGFVDESRQWKSDGHPRFYGVNGMTTVPKFLARALDVRLSTRVREINAASTLWQVVTDDDQIFEAKSLIMTPPLPQTFNLIRAGNFSLSADDQAALEPLSEYHPTFAVMARLDRPSDLPKPGGLTFNNPHSDIAWLADNTQKGISPEAFGITIHASKAYSHVHVDEDREVIGRDLLSKAQFAVGPAQVVEFQTHLWLYSEPVSTHSEPCYVVDSPAPLILAGDVFAGPRVEGAALSGLAAADLVLESLNGG